MKRWILSWGSECEVLEPEELRKLVRCEAEGILRGVKMGRMTSDKLPSPSGRRADSLPSPCGRGAGGEGGLQKGAIHAG